MPSLNLIVNFDLAESKHFEQVRHDGKHVVCKHLVVAQKVQIYLQSKGLIDLMRQALFQNVKRCYLIFFYFLVCFSTKF
jgi:hypothetical protein